MKADKGEQRPNRRRAVAPGTGSDGQRRKNNTKMKNKSQPRAANTKFFISPEIDAKYRAMTPPCTHCFSAEYTRFRYFNNRNAAQIRGTLPQARFACRSPECLKRNPGKREVEFTPNGKIRQPYITAKRRAEQQEAQSGCAAITSEPSPPPPPLLAHNYPIFFNHHPWDPQHGMVIGIPATGVHLVPMPTGSAPAPAAAAGAAAIGYQPFPLVTMANTGGSASCFTDHDQNAMNPSSSSSTTSNTPSYFAQEQRQLQGDEYGAGHHLFNFEYDQYYAAAGAAASSFSDVPTSTTTTAAAGHGSGGSSSSMFSDDGTDAMVEDELLRNVLQLDDIDDELNIMRGVDAGNRIFWESELQTENDGGLIPLSDHDFLGTAEEWAKVGEDPEAPI